MDILRNLTALLGGQSPSGPAGVPQSGADDGLGGLLSPQVLGSLASALFSGRSDGGGLGNLGAASQAGAGGLGALGGLLGSLLSGGGGGLGGLGGLLGQDEPQSRSGPQYTRQQYGQPAANSRDRAMRTLRALIYAAKSDGHIDAQEQAAITGQIRQLNVGSEGQSMIQQIMDEPVDPNRIASGIADGQEAMRLYALSYAVCGGDTYMEKNYLDGLARAMAIPDNVKAAIQAKMGRP